MCVPSLLAMVSISAASVGVLAREPPLPPSPPPSNLKLTPRELCSIPRFFTTLYAVHLSRFSVEVTTLVTSASFDNLLGRLAIMENSHLISASSW